MNLKNVAQLLSIAGTTQGIGDWRPEKGSGNFGQFEVVAADDKRYKEATKFGRKLQLEAMDRMECYDDETAALFSAGRDCYAWFSNYRRIFHLSFRWSTTPVGFPAVGDANKSTSE